MDQIFTDNYRYMVGGIVLATILAYLPYQTKWGLRLSRTMLFLAGLYPILIVNLYLNRGDSGDGYGHLVLGGLISLVMAIIGGLVGLAWLIVYARGIERR